MAKKDFSKVAEHISQATQEAPATQEAQKKNKTRKTYTAQEAAEFSNNLQTAGRKGVKLPRVNLAFAPDIYDYVKTMSKASGMTYTEFLDRILRDHKAAHEDTYQKIVDIRNSL